MMAKQARCLVMAVAFACAAPLAAQAAAPCALPSASGRFCVDVRPQGAPKVGRYDSWKVRVTRADATPAEVSLSVRGGMPGHGHGLPSTPTVRRTAPGEFLVEGLLFSMPGQWVVQFDLRADSAPADTATHRFDLGL